MKYIVLCDKASLYPNVEGCDVYSIYAEGLRILRGIRYIHHRFNILPGLKKYWLGKWRKEIGNDTNVIIFDTLFDDYPLQYLRQHKVRNISFCFRNRVHDVVVNNRMIDPVYLKKNFDCSIWSYNEDDCIAYGLNHYAQFHTISSNKIPKKEAAIRDFFFIGNDKCRLPIIKDLAKEVSSLGFTYLFKVVPENREYGLDEKVFLSKPISYSEMLREINRSKCVVDIVSNQDKGLTYRSLEASILEKKLLTNYTDIKRVDFYNPNNIFILGVDSMSDLRGFVNSPFIQVIDVYSEYSFAGFCKKVFRLECALIQH